MLHFRLKACSKCHGDLALDEGDWLCLQCGTYYYTRLYRTPDKLPVCLLDAETYIDDKTGAERVKAASLLTSAVHVPSRFSGLATTATGFGETTVFGPGALGLAAGTMTGYDHR